jgi:hypothetical protein
MFTISSLAFSSDNPALARVSPRIREVGAGRGLDIKGEGAYPLSMTSAATSSVGRKTCQYSIASESSVRRRLDLRGILLTLHCDGLLKDEVRGSRMRRLRWSKEKGLELSKVNRPSRRRARRLDRWEDGDGHEKLRRVRWKN